MDLNRSTERSDLLTYFILSHTHGMIYLDLDITKTNILNKFEEDQANN